MFKTTPLPELGASWQEIKTYAKSFSGYRKFSKLSIVAEIANNKVKNLDLCSLDELRAALFFEYRRYNHFGHDPEAKELHHIHNVLSAIREKY